jgi:hypothetical protein
MERGGNGRAAALPRGCRINARECAALLSGGRRDADSGRNRNPVPEVPVWAPLSIVVPSQPDVFDTLGTYATASHRCRSEKGVDRAPADAWSSSQAGVCATSSETPGRRAERAPSSTRVDIRRAAPAARPVPGIYGWPTAAGRGQARRRCSVPRRTGFPRSRGRSPTPRQDALPLRRWRSRA